MLFEGAFATCGFSDNRPVVEVFTFYLSSIWSFLCFLEVKERVLPDGSEGSW